MGHIISIVGTKGGTGKSTIAQNLVVYFQQRKIFGEVILVDTDGCQFSSESWADIRNKNELSDAINIVSKTGETDHLLDELSKKYGIVVVDTGGYNDESTHCALAMADIAIIPIRPKQRDKKTLNKMQQLLKDVRPCNPNLKSRVLINQCPSLPSLFKHIELAERAALDHNIIPFRGKIYHRTVFDTADYFGLTGLESTDAKAHFEIIAIGLEIEELLNEPT
jgi:chromosome partitioning protein